MKVKATAASSDLIPVPDRSEYADRDMYKEQPSTSRILYRTLLA